MSLGSHKVTLVKRTEAFVGNTVTFRGFVVDGQTVLPTPSPTNAPRKLEVIGDSITCGYGNVGTFPCSFSAQTENAF